MEEEVTIDLLPVVIEGKDSGEDVVRGLRRHWLGGGFQHHANHLLDAANEEAVWGSSYALPCEVLLQPLRPPPQELQRSFQRDEHGRSYHTQAQPPLP